MTLPTSLASDLSKPSRGHRKRARTREQLLDAAQALLASNRLGDASILDVATAAGVSNGTFYNYFQTKDELVEALALQVLEQMSEQLRTVFVDVCDPAERVVMAARIFMRRTYEDNVFGWALMRLIGSLPKMSEIIRQNMLIDLREGKARGRFRYVSEAAAVDLLLGTLVAGIRTLLEGREAEAHIRHIGEISLIGLGMAVEEAQEIACRLVP